MTKFLKRPVWSVSAAVLVLLVFVVQATAAAPTVPYTVNHTGDADDGTCNVSDCSLREAINAANTSAGPDTIQFNIPGGGVRSIRPQTPLPVITDEVTIDGYTQPGATPNTLPRGNDAVLKIRLAGNKCVPVNFCNGLQIDADHTIIQGLVIGNFSLNGILIYGSHNVVRGNFIGLNAAGTNEDGNDDGIQIGDNSNSGIKNLIGGTFPADRNLISGNGSGVYILDGPGGGEHIVQGNYIGTDRTGTLAVSNGSGIYLSSRGTLIGGETRAARNVISGNGFQGVYINALGGGAFTENTLWGNWIGTDSTGRNPLGNGSTGIQIVSGTPPASLIGGDTKRKGNRIAFNSGGGVMVETGTGHALFGNSIYSNAALGIDLEPSGVTLNDTGDGDSGANNLQNFPALKRATSSSRAIKGKLNSTPSSDFTIEFFSNPSCDASNYGEGKTFLGRTVVHTDGAGDMRFRFTSPKQFGVGQFITATATDSSGNTSEFSRCKAAG